MEVAPFQLYLYYKTLILVMLGFNALKLSILLLKSFLNFSCIEYLVSRLYLDYCMIILLVELVDSSRTLSKWDSNWKMLTHTKADRSFSCKAWKMFKCDLKDNSSVVIVGYPWGSRKPFFSSSLKIWESFSTLSVWVYKFCCNHWMYLE